MNKKRKPLELYVHIPFCIRKCAYCDFVSGPGTKAMQKEYEEALLAEIDAAEEAAEAAASSSSAASTVSAVSETPTPTPTEAPVETKIMYSTSSLNIRAAASADAEKLGTFAAGDSVTVISSENGWSKIDYNGTEAYVSSDYLSNTQPTAAPAATQAPASSDQQETMVWVSGSGKKYHSNSSCSNMSNPHQISLSDAQAQGYTPCKKCY